MGKGYKRKQNGKRYEGYRGAFLRMLPVVLAVGLVPLIVRQYKYETGLTEYPWFDNNEVSYDFFLGSKSFVLMLLAFAMLAGVIVRLWKEKRKAPFVKILIPLLGYGVLVFVSSCASTNRTFSFSGGYEHFETVWALLSYLLLVYYAFLYAKEETELQVVSDALCFGATVIGIIGTLQGLGIDLFAAKWFQRLITTDSFFQMVGEELLLNFTGNNAFATLYNPNYLGVYGSFVVPFLVMMLLFEKNKWRRIWHGGNFVLVTIALLSSRSRAGLIAVVAALCVALVFAIRKILKWWYLAIPAVNFAVVLLLLVNAYNDNVIFARLKNIFEVDSVEVVEGIAEDGTVIKKSGLTEMYTGKDGVTFRYNEMTMLVGMKVEGDFADFYAIGEDGKQAELQFNETKSMLRFVHPALSDVTLAPVFFEDRLAMQVNVAGEWNFIYNEEKDAYQYITDYGKESDMIMAESVGFENRQRWFSGRGYIWSRTIPLLKEHVFIGSGPDTFVLEYPQEDYLKMAQYGFQDSVMTKPHSWYLQVGVQTGMLSLVCLLVFYGWYAVWSMRLYAFRKLEMQIEGLGIAAFIGSIGYMVSGISNDSMVVTAPVFWGMIALGVTANVMTAKHRKETTAADGKAETKQ